MLANGNRIEVIFMCLPPIQGTNDALTTDALQEGKEARVREQLRDLGRAGELKLTGDGLLNSMIDKRTIARVGEIEVDARIWHK